MQQQTNTRSVARQPRIRYGSINVLQAAHLTSYAQFRTFYVLTTYANEHGVCFPSLATLIAETKLSRPSVYRALTHLFKTGLVTRMQHDNRFFQLHESPLGDTECLTNETDSALESLTADTSKSHGRDSLPYSNKPNEHPQGGEADVSNPKITNITSRQPSAPTPVREFGKYSKQKQWAEARPASNESQRLAEHIRKLTGIVITDAHKFDTVSYGEPVLHQYIDEAWGIRDALKSDQFAVFNAAKVLYYAANRDRLRLSTGADRREAYLRDRVVHVDRVLTEMLKLPRDQRLIQLAKLIDAFHVTRQELSGRVDHAELDELSSCFVNI